MRTTCCSTHKHMHSHAQFWNKCFQVSQISHVKISKDFSCVTEFYLNGQSLQVLTGQGNKPEQNTDVHREKVIFWPVWGKMNAMCCCSYVISAWKKGYMFSLPCPWDNWRNLDVCMEGYFTLSRACNYLYNSRPSVSLTLSLSQSLHLPRLTPLLQISSVVSAWVYRLLMLQSPMKSILSKPTVECVQLIRIINSGIFQSNLLPLPLTILILPRVGYTLEIRRKVNFLLKYVHSNVAHGTMSHRHTN